MADLAKPDYAVYDTRGAIVQMFCKVCGAIIADTVAGQFNRLHNYAELKMTFLDNSSHVTNLCTECVQVVAADKTLVKALHDADIDLMSLGNPLMLAQKDRLGPRVVAVDTKRRGIL